MAEETVNVNPDGSTEFGGGGAGEESTMPPMEDAGTDEAFKEAVGTDSAFYLLFLAIALGIIFFVYYRRSREDSDDFFSNLDGEKVSTGRVAVTVIQFILCIFGILFLLFSL